VNRVLAAVSSFYEYVIMAGQFDQANPIEKRPDPALQRVSDRHRPFMGRASRQKPIRRSVRVKTVQRIPRPLDEDQVNALLAQLKRLRDRAIVVLMLQGGLRPGEVLSLHLEDIAYGRRRVVVRHRTDHLKGARSKSRFERVVDLHEPETLAMLSAYVMQERPADSDSPLVFLIGGDGKRRLEALSYDGLVRMFSRAAAKAGIRQPWLTPRDGPVSTAVTWHVMALAIRLRLRVPQAMDDLRRLAAHRRQLGPESFTGLLTQAADDADLTETLTSLLDQLDAAGDGTP
jgi:integrase/recombinase XerD